ncbi:MAG: TonB family protein [Glaciecola sp.]|jgi:TonB family protein
MINIHTMENDELMTSFSQRHKILAAALATVFIGSGNATAKAVIDVDESEPLTTFSQAYKEYVISIKSGKYSPDELVHVAKQTYLLGKAKFGSRHQSTFMLQQNLANAYLEVGEYALSAANYESVTNYHEETQGDESQAYYFGLLDIINLIYSAYKGQGLSARDLGISQFGRNRAIAKLFEVTEALISSMPENSLMFRGHTVKTAVINNWAEKDQRLLKIAKQFNLDAKKNLGQDSVVYIESLTYVGQVYFGMQKYKDARIVFEQVLMSADAQDAAMHPFFVIAHAHLVSIYARKKETKKAIFHSQAVGESRSWVFRKKPLYQVSAKFPPHSIANANINNASVIITMDISKKGQPINMRIKSSTHADFDKLAIDSLKQWYYAPKFVTGKFTVATGFDVTINFIRE